jgi:hypothetical protein
MPLLDRFRSRPAWQSKDPEIRASAVRQLGPDQQDLILAIAREDEDPRVRRLAVRKLSDVSTLGAIAREDTDAGVRSEATEILERMAMEDEEGAALPALDALGDARHLVAAAKSARHPSVRRAALSRLTDARSLSAVARTAEDASIRQAALEGITDPAVLADLALRSDHKDLAVHAAERLDDPALLTSVAARARNKAAARRAKARLDALTAQAAPPAAAEAEEAAAPSEPSEAEAPPVADGELEAAPSAADPAEPEVEAAEAEEPPPVTAAEPEPPAPPLPDATPEQRVEQEGLTAQAQAAAESGPALQARREVQLLRKRAQEMAALGPDLVARFEAAQARAAERERAARILREREQFDNQARLQALCEKLEALAKAETVSRREAEQALRESRTVAEQPPPLPGGKDTRALMQRLKAARATLFPRVQEIREADEWTRWANATQQEELCKRVEALVAEQDLDTAAAQLREIDAQWKKVAQAPRDQAEALWRRFKAARDQVQARCREHFAQQAQERGENLKRKQALAEQAEGLAASTDWVKTADALRKLQQEWKQTGPVPRRHGKVLWERFRGACDQFFGRRKEDLDKRKQDWSRNLEKKEALCARAEELAESTEWDAASAEIKRLQAEWKTIGPVRKSRSQAVWDRFHGACDRFFERYKQRGTIERAARTATLEALAAELEAVAEEPASEDTARRAQDVLVRWRQAHGPAGDSPLAERRNRAVALLAERHPDSLRGTELDPSANLNRLEKLVARVEAQLSRPEASGSLAERLREALASNTMGGKGQAEAKWREATAEVEAAQAAFKKLGPVPGAQGEALRLRFQSACERFFELRPRLTARTR